MFGLLKLFFSRHYWRLLTRGETWRSTWIAIRRLHKDKRSWRQLARIVYLLLVLVSPLLVLLFLAFCVGAAALAASVGIGGAAIVAFLLSFLLELTLKSLARYGFGTTRKEAEQGLNAADMQFQGAVTPTPELLLEFEQITLLNAILICRASSEQFVRSKELPQGVTIVTRQRHLELLRQHGMYDKLGAQERDLLIAADGHWTEAVSNSVFALLEPLRLFRWTLRLDPFLNHPGATPPGNIATASELVDDPTELFRAKAFVTLKDIRIALRTAEAYCYRCWAEGVKRGFFGANIPEKEAELRKYAETFEGQEAGDLLLGSAIVNRSPDAEIRYAMALSMNRAETLRWIQGRMLGELPPVTELQVLSLPRNSPSEESPSA